MSNLLLKLIEQGRIKDLSELKSAYHAVTLRTHPDAAGSEEHLETFLRLNDDYLAARACLAQRIESTPRQADPTAGNPRLAFFRQLSVIEALEMPYAYQPNETSVRIDAAKALARKAIGQWRSDWSGLYAKADIELVGIKTSKPSGPYLKDALGLNIKPLMHNLIGYHLTGRDLYSKQARQNLTGIMHRLGQTGHPSLREFLSLLIEDMNKGPAVLE